MEEGDYKCSICGNPDFNLVDAIGQEEIIKVCEDCAKRERLPIIHRTSPEELSTIQRFYATKGREMQQQDQQAVSQLSTKKSEEDKELERILKQNITKQDFPDLIDNFHWHIQHARRMMKLSQKQLADSIAEKEIIVDLAEQGKLPENHEQIITKLEQFLRVKVRKEIPKEPEIIKQKTEPDSEEFNIKKTSWFSTTTTYLKNLTKKIFETSEEEIDTKRDEEVKKTKKEEKMAEKEIEKVKNIEEQKEKPQTPAQIEKREKSERELFEEYYRRSMRY